MEVSVPNLNVLPVCLPLPKKERKKKTKCGQSRKRQSPFVVARLYLCTGKSLSEALLFAEHGVNMLFTKIVLNVRNNFCTKHVLPRLELGIFMY